MRYEAATTLAPGVVCQDAVVGWINQPIFVLRPRTGPLEGRQLTTETAAYPPPFVDGDDEVLANAKRRPVLVVANRRELQIARQLRIVPIHRKSDKAFYVREWNAIVAGQVAGLIPMPDGRPAFDFDEGVLDLTEAQRIDRQLLPDPPWFKLDESSFVGVILAMQRLLQTALFRPRGN